ncbi:MAG: histidine--tRNA ligase [Alphaproteobacteria bacterium]|jgi:histidyl-tRNA synthetase|nr:histidine--tRNA ligase [Alphaproteobacteria bacterium]
MAERRIVKPQPVSGFPEWLPEQKLVEERWLAVIRREFARYGFTPIETPAIERKEVLAAKGVVEKEIYALSRLAAGEGEDPATEMALHFDLTVPLARYVAQHFASLTFPFRRYQIQKVWRGERPQAGRFREFYQCDIDAIGNGSLGLLNDAEMPCVIHAIFSQLDIGRFVVRLNNRKILQGYLESLGLPAERTPAALRVIDGLDKVGRDQVRHELQGQAGLDGAAAERLLGFLESEGELGALRRIEAGPLFEQGVAELTEVVDGLHALGMPAEAFAIDLGIARGLDYYTGTVYETVLVDRPDFGSICSGGRYDNLAGTFTKQQLPGVGISIGLTRLLARLFEAELVKPGPATAADVLVTVMDKAVLPQTLNLARDLRAAGLNTEVYTQLNKKLGDQLKYADKKGFPIVVIAGEDELARGEVTVKHLASGEQVTVPQRDLPHAVRARLAPASEQQE